MAVTCYYCNKKFPNDQMKRCSRCRLVTYCSKDCQTLSWKASHKQSCKIHPSLASSTDPEKLVGKIENPKKYSPAWVELEVDRLLSRWLQLWRLCFQIWGTICLDLANHPNDRIMTHCMFLIVQPRDFQDDPAKQYSVIDASVVRTADIQASHPDLKMTIDPTDFTRLRFVVVLQNNRGDPRRLRLFQWNDLGVEKWRTMNKDTSAKLAGGWDQALIFAVEQMSPIEVDKMLGRM